MTRGILKKQETRDKAVTVRVSETTASQLKELADRNNLSQADVIEALVQAEYAAQAQRAKRK